WRQIESPYIRVIGLFAINQPMTLTGNRRVVAELASGRKGLRFSSLGVDSEQTSFIRIAGENDLCTIRSPFSGHRVSIMISGDRPRLPTRDRYTIKVSPT